MQEFYIETNEYEIDIGELFKRRLFMRAPEGAAVFRPEPSQAKADERPIKGGIRIPQSFCVYIGSEEALEEMSGALLEMMLKDLRYFEISDMAHRLPCSLECKQRVVKNAIIRTGETTCDRDSIAELTAFLAENRRLNLEGYLRFRLRGEVEKWSAAVDSVYADEAEAEILSELFGLFGLLKQTDSKRADSVTVILQPSGGCTVTNTDSPGSVGADEGPDAFTIECAPNEEEGVLSLIQGLAPSTVTVIDLSFGRCDGLKSLLRKVFSPPGTGE